MPICDKKLHQLIPQAYPMIMLDALEHSDKNETQTTLQVRSENIFFQNGYLQEPALVENMAQTAAARAGFEAQKLQKPVRKGFIGAIKNLEIYFLPSTGDTLETTLNPIAEIGDVSVVKNTIYVNGKLCAQAEFKIFLQKQ